MPILNAAVGSGSSQSVFNAPDFLRVLLDDLYDGVYCVDRQRRITYWNRGAERLSGYSATEVVGHFCSDNILQHVNQAGTILCVNDCPLSACMMTGVPGEHTVYLHHKSGHRVQVNVRVSAIRDERGQVVGGLEIFNESAKAQVSTLRNRQFATQGFLDPLTQATTRRYMEVEMIRAMHDFRHRGVTFGAILLEIDYIQEFIEKFGHNIGDTLLGIVARTLAHAIEINDVLGRWSLNQFLVFTPGANIDSLTSLAERCRALVERSGLEVGPQRIAATVSAGASLIEKEDTTEQFLHRLENLLQQSKSAGRNCVTVSQR